MPTVKKNGMIGMKPPMAVDTRRGQRRAPRIGKRFFRQAQLLVHERAQELLRLLLDPLRHARAIPRPRIL